MRFFATRQTESRDPLLPGEASRRPSSAPGCMPSRGPRYWGGPARRLASMPPRDPRAAPTTCAAAFYGRLHHDAVAALACSRTYTYSPPLPRALHDRPREKRPRLAQQIQFRIELPPDALHHSDGHDRRREVGFQADAVPPARR